ncbi:5024_t:CDS:2, partial [Cetraspora pellucida]
QTKEQMLFLCVLLGYHMDQNDWLYRLGLPDSFPSSNMINKLEDIDFNSSMPSDTKSLTMKAIKSLVRHNSKGGFLDWIKIFALAPKIDDEYSFIDSIEIYNYKKKPDNFINLLKEIKPCIDVLRNVDALNKIMNKLIKMSYDLKSLIHLKERFKRLENNDNFQCDIRKKLLELVKVKKQYWNDKDIESLHKILKEPTLRWQHREYINILEAIAESDQIIVLDSFPEIFKYISEMNLDVDKGKIEQGSIKWFINIYNVHVANIRENPASAYRIFHYLSIMHSISTYGREISNKLMNHNTIMLLPNDSIFSIAFRIDEFPKDIIIHFISLVKDRIRPFAQDPDERLLNKVMQICNCESNLNIQNRHLQESKDIKFPNIESFQLSLFQFSKFWMTLFKAKGRTKKLRSHPYFKEAREMVIHVATNIKNQTITIRLIQKIFNSFINNNKILMDYISSVIENHPGKAPITEEILERNCNQCYIYNSKLERLQKFYDQFCPPHSVTDVQLYFEDLTKRSIDTTLKESLDRDHWKMHSMTIEVINNYYHFACSRTFHNVFQIMLESGLKVEQVMNEIIKKAIENYITMCKEYANWEKIKCVVANEFWRDVSTEHIDDEVSFMTPYIDQHKSSNNSNLNTSRTLNIQRLISSVRHLVKISPTLEKLQQLLNVVKALGVIPRDQD